jgi:GntR family transcriptional regulator
MTRYQELAAHLRTRIAHGEFAVGTVLPSENALAESYGVSRGTIRNALGTLAMRGMVEPARGTGWVISSGLQAREFGELRTFPEWAESHGLRPGGLVVESRRDIPTPSEVRALHIGNREQVLRVTRVRTLDGQPVMIERAVFAPWVAPLIESLPADEPSLVRVMLREGIRSTRGSHRVDAVAASSEDARLLGVARSSPILRVRREYGDSRGRMIEVGEDRYVGGAVAFAIDVVAQR